MKAIVIWMAFLLCIACSNSYAQCDDVYTDINNNHNVCGLYGDANGNSNWNWEITDKTLGPAYCNNWYARTSSVSTKLTLMGSPFADPGTGAIDLIRQSHDYTQAKGWVLLRRDFGCSHVTAYPYFVLYNKYTGMIRVFVYQPVEQTHYTGIAVQIEPVKNPRPATTATADNVMAAPDKYLTTTASDTIGKGLVAAGESGGSGGWTLAQFNPGFDPNIQNAVYTGAGLKFTVFGVTSFDMTANIRGVSVSSTDPKVYNYNYAPKIPPTNSGGGSFSFKATGEKFTNFGSNVSSLRDAIKKAAEGIAAGTKDTTSKTPAGKAHLDAIQTVIKALDDKTFLSVLGDVASVLSIGGAVLKLAGAVQGLFGGSSSTPASAPVYTSYNFVLNGTMTAQDIAETFILHIPGTVQPDNSNAPYYQCALGIFNLTNTPQVDVVHYFRPSDVVPIPQLPKPSYVSYRLRNDIGVSYNDGAGLDLVSVQVALMGEVLPGANGKASYDPFQDNPMVLKVNGEFTATDKYHINYMLPDFDADRLLVTFYDTSANHLHLFQTPYVNLECAKGLALNARLNTKVYLRVKAILKQKNDPANTPIIYIKDYTVDMFAGTPPANAGSYLDDPHLPPPYSNYTGTPYLVANGVLGVIQSISYSGSVSGVVYEQADNSITTTRSIVVNPGAKVVFQAGNAIYLQPGFDALAGSNFQAVITTFGWNISCGTPNIQAYQNNGGCYNTTLTALRKATDPTPASTDSILAVYPVPAQNSLTISGTGTIDKAIITIVDEQGRTVLTVNKDNLNKAPSMELNISKLGNGVYFLQLHTSTSVYTRKIVINR